MKKTAEVNESTTTRSWGNLGYRDTQVTGKEDREAYERLQHNTRPAHAAPTTAMEDFIALFD